MHVRPAAILVMLVSVSLCAQSAPLRKVSRDTLISTADPAVALVFDRSFHYAGGQAIDILKVAGAEQHFFIDAGPDHSIRRFYWIQFEHYYPANTYSYDYSGIPQKPVKVGRI
jgi:hypothetical protein